MLASKQLVQKPCGIDADPGGINAKLFPFQRDFVRWALRKGRSAIFADTGLGKTLMQIEWARMVGGRVLIVSPLAVAEQTVAEGEKIGVRVHYARKGEDAGPGVTITNYEMTEHFRDIEWNGIVLDESSILKGLSGKTRIRMTDQFKTTPFRLCCTATPAPNDIAEIANHAEFLGIMRRVDMLSSFFVHDNGGKNPSESKGYRLKGHAKEQFYRWLASWGMFIKRPSDLGYSDDGFILPPLNIHEHAVGAEYVREGELFFTGLKGISDRSNVRKATVVARVEETARIVNESPEQWIVWCGLNEESRMATAAIGGAVEVEGSDSFDTKIDAIRRFVAGDIRVLVTKPKIAGFGMNFQNCHKMAFLGLSDSWEAYYQAIRRCYRFGQESAVDVHIIVSEIERGIVKNVNRKERQSEEITNKIIAHAAQYEKTELAGIGHTEWRYKMDVASGKNWKLMLGDSCERMAEVADESVGLSVFSPPFSSLFTYSPSERDLGNCTSTDEFMAHFRFIIDHLMRVTKPGRNVACHCADIAAMMVRDGYMGVKDFSGDLIRAFESRGFVFSGRVTIDKNPQAQAIRTKSKALLFVQLHKDSAASRPALGDYILLFRKPGDNADPIVPDVGNEEWIHWAHPCWYGIEESDTLQYTTARGENDERHICPLQLGTIERCVRLWSNPGDLVLSPFAGIGSEGYVAVRYKRRFVGCELKQEYWTVAARNLAEIEAASEQPDLFTVKE